MLREAKKQGQTFQRLVHEKIPFAPLKKTSSGKRKNKVQIFRDWT